MQGKIAFGRGGLGRPVASGEHSDDEVDARQVDLRLLHVRLELLHGRIGQRHVLEHTFQLRRELATALRLKRTPYTYMYNSHSRTSFNQLQSVAMLYLNKQPYLEF